MFGTFRTLILTAVAVAAIAPSAALAQDTTDAGCGKDYSRNSVSGDYCASAPAPTPSAASVSCGKDYSRNSVDGDYCVSSVSSPIVSPAPRASLTPATAGATGHDFSWASAAAGAGAALLLAAAGVALTAVARRRRESSTVGPQQSPATG